RIPIGPKFHTTMDYANLNAFHHVEFFVSNAQQAAYWYCICFGFERFAIRKTISSTSIAIKNGIVKFIFTSFAYGNDDYDSHIIKHGDNVKDIAFKVDNLDVTINRILKNDGCLLNAVQTLNDEHGAVKMTTISTKFSDMRHTLIDISNYKGFFLPEFQGCDNYSFAKKFEDISIDALDHIVENFPIGALDDITQWSIDEKICHSEFSAMKSVLLTNATHLVQVAIAEPVLNTRRGRSQIQEYIDYNGGPGVQHMALRVSDIISTVQKMKKRGVEFLTVPSSYYDDLEGRLKCSKIEVVEDLKMIRQLNILIDFDDNGYLLQIFTQPVQDRPTLFIEIIQRYNFHGFGAGNFKALFDAVEREQAKRGTLIVDDFPLRHY
uniref:4-hydroxyphenylpyruvate dioxygenase n=1 Tax=Parascaris univalens TaxID=6257 RepID=A0A915CDF9_PARUN